MNNLLYPNKKRFYHRQQDGLNWKGLKGRTWGNVGVLLMIALIIAVAGYFSKQAEAALEVESSNYFVKKVVATEPEATTTEQEEIIAYVKQVFGKHSDKAFKVLSCENGSLNPKAVNGAGNFPAGSLDLGLFQINNHWQKIENKAFLFDYKVNTQIAYNIFSRDGYSFKLWTCGRKLGV